MDAELRKNFCACGCGNLCKNKFVHGHNGRGKPGWSTGLTKNSHPGLKESSDKRKGKPATNKGKTWEELYGLEKAQEMKEKHKKNYQQNFHSSVSRAKARKNTIVWDKGLTKAQMPKTMYSAERNAKVGRKGNQNGFKKGVASWNFGLTKETNASVANISLHQKGKKRSLSVKNNASERMKVLWQDKHYREKQLPKICKISYPNKKEVSLFDLLNQIYPNDWIFSGNGDNLICGKKPDFKHRTKNLLVEMFGCYFHSCKKCDLTFGDVRVSEEERIKFFSENGYRCLVIWEHELKDLEILKSKIIKFLEKN